MPSPTPCDGSDPRDHLRRALHAVSVCHADHLTVTVKEIQSVNRWTGRHGGDSTPASELAKGVKCG